LLYGSRGYGYLSDVCSTYAPPNQKEVCYRNMRLEEIDLKHYLNEWDIQRMHPYDTYRLI
jgi:hypothetical protein